MAHVLNAAFGPVGMLLNMTGNEEVAMRCLVASVALYIALLFPLIGFLGITGAGLALFICTVFWNYILRKSVQAKLGIEPSAAFKFVQIKKERFLGGER